jgi:hypothetical protein
MSSRLRRSLAGLGVAIGAWVVFMAVFPRRLLAPVAGAACPDAVARAAHDTVAYRSQRLLAAPTLDLLDGVPPEIRSCALPLATVAASSLTLLFVLLGLSAGGRVRVFWLGLAALFLLTARAWPILAVTAIYRVSEPHLEVFVHGVEPWPWPLLPQLGAVAIGVLLARHLVSARSPKRA